jgi:hypothetical protein
MSLCHALAACSGLTCKHSHSFHTSQEQSSQRSTATALAPLRQAHQVQCLHPPSGSNPLSSQSRKPPGDTRVTHHHWEASGVGCTVSVERLQMLLLQSAPYLPDRYNQQWMWSLVCCPGWQRRYGSKGCRMPGSLLWNMSLGNIECSWRAGCR